VIFFRSEQKYCAYLNLTLKLTSYDYSISNSFEYPGSNFYLLLNIINVFITNIKSLDIPNALKLV